MTYFHPAWLEHQRKRFTRADAYRFAPPGSPEAKPPGWLDPSATRVRLKEAQEDEARARAAAEQEALEREILALRHDFAKLKLEYELRRFQRKYSSNQPRVPAGNPDGGQWVGAFNVPAQRPAQSETQPRPTVLAQPGFGRLVAEIPVPGGRRCVYNFGPISVVAPGPTNFSCPSRAHWSAVTHGRLLNDN